MNHMYRIAVCDDQQADAEYVASFIKKWASGRAVLVHVEMFPSAEAFWFQYEEDRNFDILFLDIEMNAVSTDVAAGTDAKAGTETATGMDVAADTDAAVSMDASSGMNATADGHGMNGIELAAKIRERDHAVQIVFVTGYMDYIAEGYDVEALHYLLKPVTQERLGSVLDRAMQRVKGEEKELCLQTTDGTVRIPMGSIRYLEVQRNYVTIYAGGDYTVKRTLGELEKELDERFFRTGRSFIVNLLFVKKITKSQVYLKDGSQVPLSRGLYEEINHAVIQYF